MRHVQRGDAELALEPLQLEPHLVAEPGVEVGQRLVQQQERRLEHERAREREPLLLAAREVGRGPAGRVVETHDGERALHAGLELAAGRPPAPRQHGQREGRVREHVHVRPDRVRLEHHPEPALAGRHLDPSRRREQRPAADLDLALVRPLQAGEAAQRGRLPAPGRAEQREQLALRRLERDAVDGRNRLAPAAGLKVLREVGDAEHHGAVSPAFRASRCAIATSTTSPATMSTPSAASSGKRPFSYCSQITTESTSLPGE